jgi:predicted 3-demethylubiquinone-9 3-methyltransferase (glyoxalase superfamily)
MTNSIRNCLWFRDGRGREAAEFYCALIPRSRIEAIFDISGDGASWVIDFTLGGVPYQILDAGPMFTLSEAVSISVETEDQAETDRLWTAIQRSEGITLMEREPTRKPRRNLNGSFMAIHSARNLACGRQSSAKLASFWDDADFYRGTLTAKIRSSSPA